jgi:SAM-dependent methyltransferase
LTQDWYDAHAEHFTQRTMGNDMSDVYRRFLSHLPSKAHILDAGCGPGRDARAFVDRGFRVTAFDASIAMVERCARHASVPVHHLRFEDVSFENEFDSVWACASLLHVPRGQLPEVLSRVTRALKAGGIFYMSFQVGEDDRKEPDGRLFTNFTQQSLRHLLDESGQLAVIEMWEVELDGAGGQRKRWLHALSRKPAANP